MCGKYDLWTARVPTVVDLDENESAVLREQGDAALDAHLRSKGCFPFPALEVRQPAPACRDTTIVTAGKPVATIYVSEDPGLKRLADRLARAVRARTGVTLPLLGDEDFRLSPPPPANAIVLGGAHQSRAAATLADSGLAQTDLLFPGQGGWLVKTLHNVLGSGRNVVQVCSDGQDEAAVDALLASLHQKPDLAAVLSPTFALKHGVALARELGTRESRLQELAKEYLPPDETVPARLDVPTLAAAVCRRYDSGGKAKNMVNNAPLWMAVQVGELYAVTADRDLLELFKRLLWGCVAYHCNTPDGASYISDFDFPLSRLCMLWEQVEHDPLFSDEERLVLANMFYASAEMCHRYAEKFWALKPGEHRHNHQTFASLSLYFLARYFHSHYGLREVQPWTEHAQACFSGSIDTSFKHREDATGYQWLVPVHKVMFDTATGTHRYARSGNLARIARCAVVVTDNFGFPCDFGEQPFTAW